ncbi:MAG: rhomboid family intramembrane serine protease [Rhodothermales bacterium]
MYNSPYRPSTQFSVFPPVIKNLLIINGLVFLAGITPHLELFLQTYCMLWPIGTPDTVATANGIAVIPDFWPWQLVTYGFMHGGFTHLFFNMFALWMFGMQVENTMGSRRFATYYFTCLIGAGIIQSLVVYISGSYAPTVGASGAVFGLLLAFGLFFPEQPIYLYFLFPIKAKWFVVLFGGLELIYGVSNTQQGVAHFAHLGGMIFGFLLIQFWRGRLPIQPQRKMYI